MKGRGERRERSISTSFLLPGIERFTCGFGSPSGFPPGYFF
jgi:hypothetical protein